MEKKFREITVKDVKYGWQVKYCNKIIIWKDKNIILEKRVDLFAITPKVIRNIIIEDILNEKPEIETYKGLDIINKFQNLNNKEKLKIIFKVLNYMEYDNSKTEYDYIILAMDYEYYDKDVNDNTLYIKKQSAFLN